MLSHRDISLWGGAKRTLQELDNARPLAQCKIKAPVRGGNRFQARTWSPPFPVHCSQELSLPTNSRHYQTVLCSFSLPLASDSSSLAAVEAQRLGWFLFFLPRNSFLINHPHTNPHLRAYVQSKLVCTSLVPMVGIKILKYFHTSWAPIIALVPQVPACHPDPSLVSPNRPKIFKIKR